MTNSAKAADTHAVQDDLRSVVDTEEKRALAAKLVVAWHQCRALGIPCNSLLELAHATAEPVSHRTDTDGNLVLLTTLIEVTQLSATIAQQLSVDGGKESLRSLCGRVARDCGCTVARLKRALLF